MSSGRSTRARSRAVDPGGLGSANSTPNLPRRPPYHEPATADLPSLYPIHDGSYGVNTHINLDSTKGRRGGRKPKSGFVNEDDEDRRFMRRMRGKDGKRHGMEDDLKKVVNETVEEAERDEGVNEQPEELDDESEEDSTVPAHGSQPAARQATAQQATSQQPSRSGGNGMDGRGEAAGEHRTSRPGYDPLKPMTPFIPTLGRLFRTSGENSDEDRPKPPYTDVEYRSPNPYALIHNRHPLGLPSTRGSFYGIPTGQGSSIPNDPFAYRRGYSQERSLYHDATVRTPDPASARGSSAPASSILPNIGSLEPASAHTARPNEPAREPQPSKPVGFNTSTWGWGNNDGITRAASTTTMANSEEILKPNTLNINNGTNAANSSTVVNANVEPAFQIPTPDDNITTSKFSGNQAPSGLTEDELRIVTRLVDEMRRQAGERPVPTGSLDHLTRAEIQAARSLIQDMGRDRVAARRIVSELDKAASRLGTQEPKFSLFGARPVTSGIANTDAVGPGNTGSGTTSNTGSFVTANTGSGTTNNTGSSTTKNTDSFATANTGSVAASEDNASESLEDADDDDSDEEQGTDDSSTAEPPTNLVPKTRNPISKTERPKAPQQSRTRPLTSRIPRIPKFGAVPITNLIGVFLSLLTAVWILLPVINDLSIPSRVDIFNAVPWAGWDKINVGSLIPTGFSVPAINPTSKPISTNTGDSYGDLTLRQSKLEKSNKEVMELLENIRQKIPSVVFVELDKSGKPRISQDFWHALRDLIKEDDIILTLENAANDGPRISDQHWRAIKSRLEKDRLYAAPRDGAGESDTASDDLELAIDAKVSQSWRDWLSQNENLLKGAVAGAALTKDEFIDVFNDEIRVYQEGIQKEFAELQKRVNDLAENLTRLRDHPPAGVSREEVQKITDAAIHQALQHAKLDAVASGSIRGHANGVLVNMVNFFGIGSGAVIDPQYSSPVWKIPKDHFKDRFGFKTKGWYERDGYKAQPRSAALSSWTDEGECFCAGPNVRGQGRGTNSISVLTSRTIVPQYLVVEHILPGSTVDPGAMPRDIEVWVYVEEITLRDQLRDFARTHFPDTPQEVVLNEGYMKIGQFKYEARNYGDGVQVFKLSDQFARMGVASNQIVVRALNNYGADHTCFYRLRMYGEVVETEPWNQARKNV
ncbi:hypothetical protein AAE478_001495 [Parahypoxylon ruwenzoriense]